MRIFAPFERQNRIGSISRTHELSHRCRHQHTHFSDILGGQPKRIIALVREGTITLLTTSEMISELTNVLSYPKFARYFQLIERTVDSVIDEYRQMTEMVTPADLANIVLRDNGDVIILTAAIGGQADYIVTGTMIY